MTTATTNTTIANTSNATFQAWVNEVYTNLVTNCGLSQASDTGQMAVPCVTALPAGLSTSAGYYVFKFNDTLQATSPVFIKLEFGTGITANTHPMMWITTGSGTDGAGTVNGTALTRVAAAVGSAPVSTVTNYPSYYCYNATQGFLGMAFKFGAQSTTSCIAGFFIFRSVDATGAPTATSVTQITNAANATGNASSLGNVQVIDYSTSTAVTPAVTTAWGYIPWGMTSTLAGTTGNVFPCFQYALTSTVPASGVTNTMALAIINEVAVGATVSVTVIGSTTLTYICVGHPFGGGSLTNVAYGATNVGVLMLWQ